MGSAHGFLSWFFFKIIGIGDEAIHQYGVPEYGGNLMHQLGNDWPSQLGFFFSKLIHYLIIVFQFIIIAWILNHPVHFLEAWMIVSISFFLGIISMIPMGLVSRDASILALSVYSGIPLDVGLIIVLLLRVSITIPTIIIGIVFSLWLMKKFPASAT